MKKLNLSIAEVVVKTFTTVLGTFVASSICYTFYIVIF